MGCMLFWLSNNYFTKKYSFIWHPNLNSFLYLFMRIFVRSLALFKNLCDFFKLDNRQLLRLCLAGLKLPSPNQTWSAVHHSLWRDLQWPGSSSWSCSLLVQASSSWYTCLHSLVSLSETLPGVIFWHLCWDILMEEGRENHVFPFWFSIQCFSTPSPLLTQPTSLWIHETAETFCLGVLSSKRTPASVLVCWCSASAPLHVGKGIWEVSFLQF